MFNLSRIHQEIARAKNDEIKYPKTDKQIYWQYYFRLEKHFQEMINDVYAQSRDIIFPIDTFPLQNYLYCYSIYYVPFDKYQIGQPELEGCTEYDTEDPYKIYVMYNVRANMARQRFTQVHETIHILQRHDPEYCEFIDSFFGDVELLPLNLVHKLSERITDKMTAMYLMPREELASQYQKNKDVNYLADYFQVSKQSLLYRLKNTGILVPV